MTEFQTSVQIKRPMNEVFAYVSEPRNFPRWNSAVESVRKTSGPDRTVGSTYSMERRLPGGRAENELEVLAHQPPTEFAIQTTTGPTPFLYRYHLTSDGPATLVELDAAVQLPGVTGLVSPLAKRAVRGGVDANLAELKGILEF